MFQERDIGSTMPKSTETPSPSASGNPTPENHPDPYSPDHDSDAEAAEGRHEQSLSHPEALRQAREHIKQLLSDPFLQDLPSDISLDELRSKLALEQGRAITIHLRRYDDEVLPIIVFQGATVQDLRKAIENEIARRCRRDGRTEYLNWKYIWRTYWLAHGQQRLEDLQAKLASYGIGNHSEVTFVKKLRQNGKGKRPMRPCP